MLWFEGIWGVVVQRFRTRRRGQSLTLGACEVRKEQMLVAEVGASHPYQQTPESSHWTYCCSSGLYIVAVVVVVVVVVLDSTRDRMSDSEDGFIRLWWCTV